MVTIDAGSPILVEIKFTRAEPFKTYMPFDPTTATYTTYDPTGEAITEASGSLSKVATDSVGAGRYYCVIHTQEDWQNGEYKVKIYSSYGTNPNTVSDIDIKETAFIVKNGE